METFIVFVLIECAAVILTNIGCRLASWRHRQAGWGSALFGAVGVAALAILLDNGSLLFHPSQWSQNKRSLEGFLVIFVFLTGVAIIPALFVVRYYRGKFRADAKSVV
jgi:hypothetical protein